MVQSACQTQGCGNIMCGNTGQHGQRALRTDCASDSEVTLIIPHPETFYYVTFRESAFSPPPLWIVITIGEARMLETTRKGQLWLGYKQTVQCEGGLKLGKIDPKQRKLKSSGAKKISHEKLNQGVK